MIGTALNVAGILAGGLAGLLMRRPLAASTQAYLKIVLAVFTVWIGLKLAVSGLHGTVWQIGKQLLVVVLAMAVGRLIGRLFRLQKSLNRLGRLASEKLALAKSPSAASLNDGFTVASILFCAAPLAVLGSVPDGLSREYQPLLLKGVMDGLVAMALVATFRWPVLLGAVPAAALQLSIAMVARYSEPFLVTYSLVDSVMVVCGLLIFCLSLIIFGIRKVEVGDYFPALVIAPLVSYVWR